MKEQKYGWLSPDGEFYEMFTGHEQFARELLEDEEFEVNNRFKIYAYGDELIRRGWVLIHNPPGGVGKSTLNINHKLTKKQREFLFLYYTKNKEYDAANAAEGNYIEDIPEFFDLIDVDGYGRG